nr:hypothetical protein [Tanacetum cinerariifolium]
MVDKEKKSTTKGFATNDQAYYYSGVTSITVNGKNAYELKGKFRDDLHNNAFSGTNREDVVDHIEYFLKNVYLIDLPNVNKDKLRIVVFPISLVGNAWRWFDEIKGSITSWIDLTAKFCRKYYPPSRTGKINTPIIKWDPTNLEFKNWLASNFMNYMTMDIFTKRALWDYWKLGSNEVEPTNEKTFNLKETNQDDEQEIGNALRYQDLEWYDALNNSERKEEALRNKAIEGVKSNDEGWKSWDDFENTNGDRNEWEYENEHEDDEIHELCGNETHELPVCNIRRFEMIK